MSASPKTPPPSRRRNKAVSVADALGNTLDPALKKRGFASRDLLTHWAALAPDPFNSVAAPDKLVWPRGEARAEGATLYLRSAPGHGLAIAHEGPRIAAAVNRYFGYVLVKQVKLSAEPFVTTDPRATDEKGATNPLVAARVDRTISHVADEDLREALRVLGEAVVARAGKGGRA